MSDPEPKPLHVQVRELEERSEKLRMLCGEMLACLRVNRLRETLSAKDEAGNREFDALIERWRKWMIGL